MLDIFSIAVTANEILAEQPKSRIILLARQLTRQKWAVNRNITIPHPIF